MQGTMPGARRRGRPRTDWMDNIKTWTGLSVEESVGMTDDGQMEKVRPWCGRPSDRGRLKNRTEQTQCTVHSYSANAIDKISTEMSRNGIIMSYYRSLHSAVHPW